MSTINETQANGMRDAGCAKVQHFTDLDAWKLAHELTVKIYHWTKDFPDDERFGLISQMRRAAVSITSNIAEGFGRISPADKKHFYVTARSSCFELESQIIISNSLGLLSAENRKESQQLSERVRQTLNGLIRFLKNKLSNPASRPPHPAPQFE